MSVFKRDGRTSRRRALIADVGRLIGSHFARRYIQRMTKGCRITQKIPKTRP
jgi:hypothetical protein